jgi:thioredoxin-dependent peroxiredoxin
MHNIRTNTRALNFNTIDFNGNPISLQQYQGKKVMLSFFRTASCPFCNMRVQALIKHYDQFQSKNVELISVFASSSEEINQYAGGQNPPFRIIPDPELRLYKKYGIESSSVGMFRLMMKPLQVLKVMTSGFFNMKSVSEKPIIPADFLIDENQMVVGAYYGKDFGDHIPIQRILEWS